ncbi:MAG: iron chelate uptake ABC transporter family permease subunit, partial [Pseudomonadota bacterium]
LACLFATARALDALSLGEDAARSLGLEPRITQALLIIGTALAVGAATSVAGTIGFVGLVVPHLLRPFARHRPSQLLPLAGIGGAILVVYADVVLRLASPSGALRLGVFTALLGAPLFLWLVHKTRSALTP